jgi:hypothetical protein
MPRTDQMQQCRLDNTNDGLRRGTKPTVSSLGLAGTSSSEATSEFAYPSGEPLTNFVCLRYPQRFADAKGRPPDLVRLPVAAGPKQCVSKIA